MSESAAHPLPEDRARPLVLAHRGGHGPWRENTLPAFRHALEVGADGVELDVWLTGDGSLVVHHDPQIDGVGDPIHQMRSGDLPSWVPTLDEALEECEGSVVNVELKAWATGAEAGAEERLAAAVGRRLMGRLSRDDEPPPVLVSSFSHSALQAFSRTCPTNIPTGLLLFPGLDPLGGLEEARALDCRTLNPFHEEVTPELVLSAHKASLAVVTWTVNEPAALVRVGEAGVDVVITDDPSTAIGLLR